MPSVSNNCVICSFVDCCGGNSCRTLQRLYTRKIAALAQTEDEFASWVNPKIDLSNLHVKSLPQNYFVGLERLHTIDLSSNDFVELPWWTFEHIQELKHLRLANNDRLQFVSSGLSTLAHIRKLDLDLSNCPLLTNPQHYRECYWETLEQILISKTFWSGVNLSGCGLKYLPRKAFRFMSNLEEINLSNNKLKEYRVQIKGAALSSVNVILSGNPIRYVDCVAETLVLDGCGLNSITALLSLETKANLQALRLENNHISSIKASDFPAKEFSSLTTLGLSNNKIRQIEENVLSKLPCLTSLYLDNNQISYVPEGLFNISVNSRWHWVSLSNNQISYIHPNAFQTRSHPNGISEILLEIDHNPGIAFRSTECEFPTFAEFQTHYLEPLFVAQDMLETVQKQSRLAAFHEEFIMKLMAPERMERLIATHGMEAVLDGFDF